MIHRPKEAKPSSSIRQGSDDGEIERSQALSTLVQSPIETKTWQDLSLVDEEIFENEVSLVAERLEDQGANIDLVFESVIGGRKTTLFRIWQVVQSDEFGGVEEVATHKQWKKVASKLNFKKSQLSSAAAELEAFSEDILRYFAESKTYYAQELNSEDEADEGSLTGSQEKAMLEGQILQETDRGVRPKGDEDIEEAESGEDVEEEDEHDDDLD